MKFFAIIYCVGFTQAFLVRREADAEPEADADADAGYGGYIGGAVSPSLVSAPVCSKVPEEICADRQVETPSQRCHQEHDIVEDTVYKQHCVEEIKTTCVQDKTQTRHSSGIVGQDSKVVATGVIASPEVTVAHGPSTGVVAGYGAVGGVVSGGVIAGGAAAGYGAIGSGVLAGGAIGHGAVISSGYGKRDAEAEADAEADADAGYGYNAISPVAVSAPRCSSVPTKQCSKVPVSTQRKIGKTVCKTVTDVKTIKDCKVITKTVCTQEKTDVVHHSAVVGHDTKVGPSAVVATHGTVATGVPTAGVATTSGVVAGYGAVGGLVAGGAVAAPGVAVAGSPVVAGYAGTGYGLAGQW